MLLVLLLALCLIFGLPLGLEAPVMMPNGVIFLFFLLCLSWCQLQHSNTVKECPVLGHLVIIRSTLPSLVLLGILICAATTAQNALGAVPFNPA